MSRTLIVDNAKSTCLVAVDIGGTSLLVNPADANKFGSPTNETPLLLSVFDAEGVSPLGVLTITGRSGSTLTISPATFAAAQNSVVACVPLAAHFDDVYDEIAEVALPPEDDSSKFLSGDHTFRDLPQVHWGWTPPLHHASGIGTAESPIIITCEGVAPLAYVDAQLLLKEPKLPMGGNANNYLRGDKTWAVLPAYALETDLEDVSDRVASLESVPAPPQVIIPLARWAVAGTAIEVGQIGLSADTFTAYRFAGVTCNAVAGGFSFAIKINNVDVMTGTYEPEDAPAVRDYLEGPPGTEIPQMSLLTAEITSATGTAEGLVLTLWGTPL